MTAYVITSAGSRYALENCLEWEFDYGTGVPCDSFRVVCLWDGEDDSPLLWQEFLATEDGETVFYGVVDECETSFTSQGMLMEISGRGMAALLLDNEAIGRDYETATTQDILKDHVTCFGVEVGDCGTFDSVSPFDVTSGGSAWSVVYDFFCYYGGVAPYFDRQGRLQLKGRTDGSAVVVDDSTPLIQLKCRDQRYGVISQIFLRNTSTQGVITMENMDFYNMGGRCRRVVSLPDDNFIRSARYSGQFQIDRSNEELLRLEVEVAEGFFAMPGDLVTIERTGWGRNGTYRAISSRVTMSDSGFVTYLELADRDILI